MRVLLLLRGIQGSGKSTWIKENDLSMYTLSSDSLRLLFRSPTYDKFGKENIDQSANKEIWETLFKMLEYRMSKGEFTIIDACNVKENDILRYKALADKYKYRVYCVDFSDVTLEQAKLRNAQRSELKQVPNDVIEQFYANMQAQKIPKDIKVIDRNNWLNEIGFKCVSLDAFKKVVVIGDIHGCYTALQELLKGGLNDDTYYIFVGDYMDRGMENGQTMEFMLSIMECPNVCLLEGNHERWINRYSHDEIVTSREFILNTQPQIAEISKKSLRIFYRKLRQCILFDFCGKRYFVSHAGVSRLNDRDLIFMATDTFINGVGEYADVYDCHRAFANRYDIIQIHGHRNVKQLPIYQDGAYNLEGSVEFGGYLRAVEISKNGILPIEIKNNVYRNDYEKYGKRNEGANGECELFNLVEKLRSDKKSIKEKQFDNISSFNFTKGVFYDKNWNNTTTKARGLFVNTDNYTISARAYDKFFNINERRETELNSLKVTLKFPVSCYLKYNGFLGILGYDEKNNKLLFCSKSSIGGKFSECFENIFMSKYKDKYDEILAYIKENNVSLIFEVIDNVNDPHIIKYSESDIILLDVVSRDISFKNKNYKDLQKFAKEFGFNVKEIAYTLNSWQEFEAWYSNVVSEDFKYEGEYVEGFVVVDSNNFMTKVKCCYYSFWKFMRSIAEDVLMPDANGVRKGVSKKISGVDSEECKKFYEFLLELYSNNYCGSIDIITLREMYLSRDKDKE